ncbi:MAG: BMP family protein [Armatimonadetes bacterium]|nr:BMP family protein [Armatimonadota bacterium]
MRPVLATLAAALVFAAGCTGGAPTADNNAAQKESELSANKAAFKVALLTPGPVSDAGWSAMAYRGLQAIQKECGAEVNNQEAKDAQIRDAMRSYAQKGYKLIIGHGFEYNAPGVEVAKDFPNTVFVSSSGGATAPNAGAFRFKLEQGFYLAGMTAGLMTKTGKVAMIGGPDVPSIRSTFKAFRAGAMAARPGIQVIETFTLKDSDVAAANQSAMKAIEEGADLLIHQANAAAQGVFNACKDKHVLAFGANMDQNDNDSGAVLASAVIVAEPAFVALAKKVRDGQYKGEIESVGMETGAIDYIWNPALKAQVPQAVMDKVEAAKRDILSGKLAVPMDKF